METHVKFIQSFFVCLLDELKGRKMLTRAKKQHNDNVPHVIIMLLRSINIKKTCKSTDILKKWEKKKKHFHGWLGIQLFIY